MNLVLNNKFQIKLQLSIHEIREIFEKRISKIVARIAHKQFYNQTFLSNLLILKNYH